IFHKRSARPGGLTGRPQLLLRELPDGRGTIRGGVSLPTHAKGGHNSEPVPMHHMQPSMR
ncbi:MAG: hypothetical protein ACXWEM_06855, partial [Halobacteriota archaeon]